ncbi:MAG TPA: hypothetical protein VGR50_00055 [Terriglobales bacterium]|nr:hypothetical protein [Terriglobales bacterium]
MSQEPGYPMQCAEFEAVLTEAVEGQLSGLQMQHFRSHAQECSLCGPLFTEAQAGYESLQALSELEPPANMLHNILAATSEAERAEKAAVPSAWGQLRNRMAAVFAPVFAQLMQPRIAGSVAMAFFSLTLLLNITGVHVTDVKHLDLSPHGIKSNVQRGYFEASARVVKYYDSLRIVYEAETRWRDLQQSIPVGEQKPAEKRQKREKNNRDMSQQPDHEQNQNYSQQMPDGLLEAVYKVPNDPAIQPSLGCESRARSQV